MIYSLLGRIEIQAFPHITSVLFDPNGANYRIFLCMYPMPAGAAPWQLQKEARIDMQLHPHRGAVVLRARPCPLFGCIYTSIESAPIGVPFQLNDASIYTSHETVVNDKRHN